MFNQNVLSLKKCNLNLADKLIGLSFDKARETIDIAKSESDDVIFIKNNIPLESTVNPIEEAFYEVQSSIKSSMGAFDFIIIFGGTNGQYYHKSEMLIANLHLIRNEDVDCSTSKHEIVKTSERLNPLKIKEESPESRNSRRSKDYFSWDDPERGIAHKYYETFHLKSKDIESKMNDIYIESNNYTPNQFS